MESSLQAFHNYKNERHEKSNTQRNSTNNSNPQQSSNNRTPRVVRFIKRQPGNQPNGNSHYTKTKGPVTRSNTRPENRPSGSNHNINNRERDTRHAPRPSGNNNKSNPQGNTQARGASNNVECWRCGKKGHYSTDCNDTPRVFAAQVIQEDDEEKPPLPENIENDEKEDSF